MSHKLRIGFHDFARPGWTGGGHYLKNLFFGLKAVRQQGEIERVLLSTSNQADPADKDLETVAMPRRVTPPLGWRLARMLSSYGLFPKPVDQQVRFVNDLGLDCLFSTAPYGHGLHPPLIGWIPDFQHRRLPEFFSPEDRAGRDTTFRELISASSRVILSSQAARLDLEKYYPDLAPKAKVVPFVAQIPPESWLPEPSQVADHYHLPERFFYMPNQFWMHKNHKLVLDALAKVKQEMNQEFTVVATGNFHEYRRPLYFGELLADIASRGLRDNFIVLGLVPFTHIFALMRQSLAVLQPSLFEGWSTTVEEAKSLGKPILLSDIQVHREQDPPAARYFDPSSPEELALCLSEAASSLSSGPDHDLEAQAAKYLPGRTRQFGEAFLSVVQEVISM